jgi:hypothetical protein
MYAFLFGLKIYFKYNLYVGINNHLQRGDFKNEEGNLEFLFQIPTLEEKLQI